jgi:hypothetical protein
MTAGSTIRVQLCSQIIDYHESGNFAIILLAAPLDVYGSPSK